MYTLIVNCETLEYTFINTAAINEIEQSEKISVIPNPFHRDVRIEYAIDRPGPVRLEILNSNGQLVKQLFDEIKSLGLHRISWNAEGFPCGLYFCRLTADGNTISRKLILE